MFDRLMGRWKFSRKISSQGSMVGVATFVPVNEDSANYYESGELSLLHGGRLRADQRYLYERTESGFAIYFPDSKELFQRVLFVADGCNAWNGKARYLCNADLYESEYCFRNDGTFAIRHEVRGPKKDFMIETLYRRD